MSSFSILQVEWNDRPPVALTVRIGRPLTADELRSAAAIIESIQDFRAEVWNNDELEQSIEDS